MRLTLLKFHNRAPCRKTWTTELYRWRSKQSVFSRFDVLQTDGQTDVLPQHSPR